MTVKLDGTVYHVKNVFMYMNIQGDCKVIA
jgi:hypothetical protein